MQQPYVSTALNFKNRRRFKHASSRGPNVAQNGVTSYFPSPPLFQPNVTMETKTLFPASPVRDGLTITVRVRNNGATYIRTATRMRSATVVFFSFVKGCRATAVMPEVSDASSGAVRGRCRLYLFSVSRGVLSLFVRH